MTDFTAVQTWRHNEVTLTGTSWAGIATSIVWKELSLCLDVAQGLPHALPASHYLITHGHMDHAGGIPYIISQKALLSLKPGRFFMPTELVEPLTSIVETWAKIENHHYNYEFIPVTPGERYDLKGDYYVKPFATVHRVPSVGYTVFHKHKKLAPEFVGLPEKQLADLHRRGRQLNVIIDEPILTYTGDTQIEFLDGPDHIRKSRILMLEVTYIDDKKSVAATREWGHIHWHELLPRLKDLECEKVLLMHLSSRHRPEELKAILQNQLPEEWQGRVDVFPRLK